MIAFWLPDVDWHSKRIGLSKPNALNQKQPLLLPQWRTPNFIENVASDHQKATDIFSEKAVNTIENQAVLPVSDSVVFDVAMVDTVASVASSTDATVMPALLVNGDIASVAGACDRWCHCLCFFGAV